MGRIQIDLSEDRYGAKTRPIFEQDTGHILELSGMDISEYEEYIAEFSWSLMHGDAKGYPMTKEEDKLVVRLPDDLLNTNDDYDKILFCFITGKNEKSGRTVASFKIPVTARPKNVE